MVAEPTYIAPDDDTPDDAEEVPFTVGFKRDGAVEKHNFVARPAMPYKTLSRVLRLSTASTGKEKIVPEMERLIRRSLVDDDGVPASWHYDPDGDEPVVTGPDGEEITRAQAAKYARPEAGSSRRRWRHLMDEDDDLEISLNQVIKVFELITEKVGDRPTSRSSR